MSRSMQPAGPNKPLCQAGLWCTLNEAAFPALQKLLRSGTRREARNSFSRPKVNAHLSIGEARVPSTTNADCPFGALVARLTYTSGPRGKGSDPWKPNVYTRLRMQFYERGFYVLRGLEWRSATDKQKKSAKRLKNRKHGINH